MLGAVVGVRLGVGLRLGRAEDGDGGIEAADDGEIAADGDIEAVAPAVGDAWFVGDEPMQALTSPPMTSRARQRTVRRGITRIGRAPASHL